MIRKLILLVSSLLFVAISAEIGLRIYYVFMDTRNYEKLIENMDRTTARKNEYKWGVDVIVRSKCQFCLYENRPNFSGNIDFGSKPPIVRYIHHNNDGLRADKNYSLRKPRDIYKRVVVLGDSGMYGWGLSDKNTYSAILERLLNERYNGKYKFEVLNLGVPGYQAIQTIGMVFCKATKYSPDIVITATYGLLDLDFVDYIYPKFRFSERISFLFFQISKLFNTKYYHSVLDYHVKQAKWTENYGHGKGNMEHYPEYEQWIGIENARKSMLRLKEYTDSAGIYLLDLFLYFGNDWARSGAVGGFDTPDKTVTDPVERVKRTKEIGIKTIDGFILAEKYIQQTYPTENIDVYKTSLLSVSKQDCHPNEIANRLLAEATVREMLRDGVIPGE